MKRAYNVTEAHDYLGIKRKAFDKHIRPQLPAPTRLGTTKVWERTDLDLAFESAKANQVEEPEVRAVAKGRERKSSRARDIFAAEPFESVAARILAQRRKKSQ